VLAVVGEQPITVLPHPRARPTDHFSRFEARSCAGLDPDGAAVAETGERNLLDRPSMQSVRESSVMHDVAVADVDTMMQIAAPRGNNV
jgi:hypothetical protein